MYQQLEALRGGGTWDVVPTYVDNDVVPVEDNTTKFMKERSSIGWKQGLCDIPPKLSEDVFVWWKL